MPDGEIRHGLEVGRVAREVVALRAVDEVADGELGAADRRSEATVLGVDGLDADGPRHSTSSPGSTSVTRRKPRRRRPLPIPRGTTMGTSIPSRRSDPWSRWSQCEWEMRTTSTFGPVRGLERRAQAHERSDPRSAGWGR